MKNQNGAISGAVLGVLGFFGVLVIVALVAFGSYVSANNYGVQIEAQLKAELQNNKNLLSQGQQKVLEVAQVPEMYAADLQKIVEAAIQGRYGQNGSQATMQWLQEQNPNLDSALYAKIQQVIEAYRDEFKNGQTKMIDVKRSYETNLGYFWKGLWLRIAGFPKLNLDEFKPITTDRVEDTYQKGKESGPLKLRQS